MRSACCCSKTNARMLISHVEPGRGRTAARDTADVQTASGILQESQIFDPICSISIAKRLFSNHHLHLLHLLYLLLRRRHGSEKPLLITVDVQSSVCQFKMFPPKPLCCSLLINTWLHLSYSDAAALIQKAIRGAKPTKPLDASPATTINQFTVSHCAAELHRTQTPKEESVSII